MGEWVTVGGEGDVPEGEARSFDAGADRVAVARSNGSIYAFDDTCTHRQCSLGEGEVEDTSIICPCHAGEFDMTSGEVLSGPPPERISVYPVRVQDGSIEVEV